MKFLKIEANHFGGIESVAVELGPGLNVLYGPNEIGKSMLARAVRVGLLMQHSSSEVRDFADWFSAEAPRVRLTLELPDRRVWRVEKRFGSPGMSQLDESKDGLTFSPYKKAREVDEELRTQLGWGIASPATKGAPRGLPPSFLASVLLGEQADVTSVLTQALDEDSDESGRAQLTKALAAFAQDPMFKRILEQAQTRVDEAFTPNGKPKTGKASPFREATDEAKRLKNYVDLLKRKLDDSENAQRILEQRNSELTQARDALDEAERRRDAFAEARKLEEARATIQVELRIAEERLKSEEAERTSLQKREEERDAANAEAIAAREKRAGLTTKLEACVADERMAEDALRRARSDEAERERHVRRAEIEKQIAEQKSHRMELARLEKRASDAVSLEGRTVEAQRRQDELTVILEGLEKRRADADRALREADLGLSAAEAASRLLEKRKLESRLAELNKAKVEAAEARAQAAEFRHRAQEIESEIQAELPTQIEYEAMVRLSQVTEVAEAKLGGGLSVVIQRVKDDLRVHASVDGKDVGVPSSGDVALDANRTLSLRIGDVAIVSVSAGEQKARQDADALRRQWRDEVLPVLQRFGCADLGELRSRLDARAAAVKERGDSLRRAEELEERARYREGQVSDLEQLQSEIAAMGPALTADAIAAASEFLDSLRGRTLDVVRSGFRAQRARAEGDLAETAKATTEAQTQREVVRERLGTVEASLVELGDRPADSWSQELARVKALAERLAGDEERSSAELTSLTDERDAELVKAESAFKTATEARQLLEGEIKAANATAEELAQVAARAAGEVAARREAVLKLDMSATQAVLAELASRLAQHPAPAAELLALDATTIDEAVVAATTALESAKGAAQEAAGALQTVGGQVVQEEYDAAQDALVRAEQRERDIGLDYEAWKLLVGTLREAENTEGLHLGRALSAPVSQRFGELTGGRYGKLDVTPNLSAEKIEAAGTLRSVSSLSVGTQEQLATLLRLTVAEQLGCAILLDDQLTQTDPARGAWFLEMLKRHAERAQIVVLTCRPLDYLRSEDFPPPEEAVLSRAGGLLRSVDLSKLIKRTPKPSPGTSGTSVSSTPP